MVLRIKHTTDGRRLYMPRINGRERGVVDLICFLLFAFLECLFQRSAEYMAAKLCNKRTDVLECL